MMNHGWPKISKFDQISPEFVRFMGLSSQMSLGLAVFAEFFCAFLIVFGLFTRFALIPLMITMLMALHVKDWQLIGQGNNELAMVFFIGFLALFILGPGKYSMDAMVQKSRR